MNDDDFYAAVGVEGVQKSESKLNPLPIAKEKAFNFPIDKQIYIVRGQSLFAVHADHMTVSKPTPQGRTIIIKEAKLVRYKKDGTVISD